MDGGGSADELSAARPGFIPSLFDSLPSSGPADSRPSQKELVQDDLIPPTKDNSNERRLSGPDGAVAKESSPQNRKRLGKSPTGIRAKPEKDKSEAKFGKAVSGRSAQSSTGLSTTHASTDGSTTSADKIGKTIVSLIDKARDVSAAPETVVGNFLMEKDNIGSFDNLESPSRFRIIVNSPRFTLVVTLLILVNTAYIGIETDHNRDTGETIWLLCDAIFATLFTLELLLRMLGRSLWRTYLRDPWNIFDIFLVCFALIDLSLEIASRLMSSDGTGGLSQLTILRVGRILRLVRIVRLLRFFKELWLIVSGILESLKLLVWTWLLILLVIYIFGIFVTRSLGQPYGCAAALAQVGQCDPSMDEYFGNVVRSMFTLFQMMTLEKWSEIARASMIHDGASWLLFILFLTVTTFAILNVVIAVIVEKTMSSVAVIETNVGKSMDKDRHGALQQLREIFNLADAAHQGMLTRDMFKEALKNPEVIRNLHAVDIDLRREGEGLFDTLDFDDSGSLDMDEFCQGALRARGVAKSKDILALQCDLFRTQQAMIKDIGALRKKVSTNFSSIELALEPVRLHLGMAPPPSCKSHRTNQSSGLDSLSSCTSPPDTPSPWKMPTVGGELAPADIPGRMARTGDDPALLRVAKSDEDLGKKRDDGSWRKPHVGPEGGSVSGDNSLSGENKEDSADACATPAW